MPEFNPFKKNIFYKLRKYVSSVLILGMVFGGSAGGYPAKIKLAQADEDVYVTGGYVHANVTGSNLDVKVTNDPNNPINTQIDGSVPLPTRGMNKSEIDTYKAHNIQAPPPIQTEGELDRKAQNNEPLPTVDPVKNLLWDPISSLGSMLSNIDYKGLIDLVLANALNKIVDNFYNNVAKKFEEKYRVKDFLTDLWLPELNNAFSRAHQGLAEAVGGKMQGPLLDAFLNFENLAYRGAVATGKGLTAGVLKGLEELIIGAEGESEGGSEEARNKQIPGYGVGTPQYFNYWADRAGESSVENAWKVAAKVLEIEQETKQEASLEYQGSEGLNKTVATKGLPNESPLAIDSEKIAVGNKLEETMVSISGGEPISTLDIEEKLKEWEYTRKIGAQTPAEKQGEYSLYRGSDPAYLYIWSWKNETISIKAELTKVANTNKYEVSKVYNCYDKTPAGTTDQIASIDCSLERTEGAYTFYTGPNYKPGKSGWTGLVQRPASTVKNILHDIINTRIAKGADTTDLNAVGRVVYQIMSSFTDAIKFKVKTDNDRNSKMYGCPVGFESGVVDLTKEIQPFGNKNQPGTFGCLWKAVSNIGIDILPKVAKGVTCLAKKLLCWVFDVNGENKGMVTKEVQMIADPTDPTGQTFIPAVDTTTGKVISLEGQENKTESFLQGVAQYFIFVKLVKPALLDMLGLDKGLQVIDGSIKSFFDTLGSKYKDEAWYKEALGKIGGWVGNGIYSLLKVTIDVIGAMKFGDVMGKLLEAMGICNDKYCAEAQEAPPPVAEGLKFVKCEIAADNKIVNGVAVNESNGIAEPGETILLKVYLRNLSANKIENFPVTMKNVGHIVNGVPQDKIEVSNEDNPQHYTLGAGDGNFGDKYYHLEIPADYAEAGSTNLSLRGGSNPDASPEKIDEKIPFYLGVKDNPCQRPAIQTCEETCAANPNTIQATGNYVVYYENDPFVDTGTKTYQNGYWNGALLPGNNRVKFEACNCFVSYPDHFKAELELFPAQKTFEDNIKNLNSGSDVYIKPFTNVQDVITPSGNWTSGTRTLHPYGKVSGQARGVTIHVGENTVNRFVAATLYNYRLTDVCIASYGEGCDFNSSSSWEKVTGAKDFVLPIMTYSDLDLVDLPKVDGFVDDSGNVKAAETANWQSQISQLYGTDGGPRTILKKIESDGTETEATGLELGGKYEVSFYLQNKSQTKYGNGKPDLKGDLVLAPFDQETMDDAKSCVTITKKAATWGPMNGLPVDIRPMDGYGSPPPTSPPPADIPDELRNAPDLEGTNHANIYKPIADPFNAPPLSLSTVADINSSLAIKNTIPGGNSPGSTIIEGACKGAIREISGSRFNTDILPYSSSDPCYNSLIQQSKDVGDSGLFTSVNDKYSSLKQNYNNVTSLFDSNARFVYQGRSPGGGNVNVTVDVTPDAKAFNLKSIAAGIRIPFDLEGKNLGDPTYQISAQVGTSIPGVPQGVNMINRYTNYSDFSSKINSGVSACKNALENSYTQGASTQQAHLPLGKEVLASSTDTQYRFINKNIQPFELQVSNNASCKDKVIPLALILKTRLPNNNFDRPSTVPLYWKIGGGEYPQCVDRKDNDSDNKIDYLGGPSGEQPDPGCANIYDDSEGTSASVCRTSGQSCGGSIGDCCTGLTCQNNVCVSPPPAVLPLTFSKCEIDDDRCDDPSICTDNDKKAEKGERIKLNVYLKNNSSVKVSTKATLSTTSSGISVTRTGGSDFVRAGQESYKPHTFEIAADFSSQSIPFNIKGNDSYSGNPAVDANFTFNLNSSNPCTAGGGTSCRAAGESCGGSLGDCCSGLTCDNTNHCAAPSTNQPDLAIRDDYKFEEAWATNCTGCSPNNLKKGDRLRIYFDIQNISSVDMAASDKFNLEIWYRYGDSGNFEDSNLTRDALGRTLVDIAGLKAGRKDVHTIDWDIREAKNLYFMLKIDPQNKISESNENNNEPGATEPYYMIPIGATPPQPPAQYDAEVESVTLDNINPDPASRSVYGTVKLKNNSNVTVPVGDFRYDWYLDEVNVNSMKDSNGCYSDSGLIFNYIGDYPFNDLSAGEEVNKVLSESYVGIQSNKNYQLRVHAYIQDQNETNLNNNIKCSSALHIASINQQSNIAGASISKKLTLGQRIGRVLEYLKAEIFH